MINLSGELLQAIEAGATLVVPSRQRAAAVRLAYAARQAAQGAGVWASPRVHSLGGWLQRLSQTPARDGRTPLPRILPTHEEWLLWRKAAAAILESEPALGGTALTADSLADSLQASAELMGRWRIPDAALSGRGTEARWLQTAMREVRDAASAIGALPRADLPAALRALVVEPATAPSADGAAAAVAGTFLAGVTLDRGLAALADSPLVGPLATIALGAPCTPVVEANADPAAEWRAAAEWCRQRIVARPDARLLVVIPDLAKRRPWVERVFREVLNPGSLRDACERGEGAGALAFAIEGGRPLAEYPEPEAALQALRVLCRPCHGADLALSLEAPWWSVGSRGARARIAARLREDLPQRILPASLGKRLRALAGRGGDLAAIEGCAQALDAAVARIAAGPGATPHWAAVFEAALRDLGWPGEVAADSGTQQARLQWRSLLESFVGVSRMAPPRDAGRAVDLLAALARREYFAPSSGDVAVLVTAALEAPVARYDGIRVCGLQADRFPAPVQVDPFVPWELQREAGIPRASPEGQLSSAEAALEAWRCCTDELVLSWALGEEDAHWMPSPLLAPWQDPGAARSKDAVEAARAARSARLAASLPQRLRGEEVALERWTDTHGLAWPSTDLVPGGVGTLDHQIDCPFRAYALRRLDARVEDVAEQGVSALERGRLLHLALKYFWDETRDQASLTALDHHARVRRLGKAIDDALQELDLAVDGDALRARLLARERERALTLGLEVLGVDETRGGFEVVLREEPVEASIGGARIAGRLDRADRIGADGSLAVVDYKTGVAKKLVWDGPDMSAVQLWAYACMIESRGMGEVRAVGNLHLARKGVGYIALAQQAETLPGARTKGWNEAQSDAAARLPALAAGFLAGEARVAPRSKACEHCDLTALCRKSELAIDRESDEGDAGADGSGAT